MLNYRIMRVQVIRLSESAKVPTYAHPFDAGMDLFASEEVKLAVGERGQIRTGIALAVPEGYVGLIWDKSGLAQKYGLKTLGGVIDSGYRGEILVGIVNLGNEPYTLEAGHKVAQLLIQKVERVEFEETDTLSDTSRGTGGFGSTGR